MTKILNYLKLLLYTVYIPNLNLFPFIEVYFFNYNNLFAFTITYLAFCRINAGLCESIISTTGLKVVIILMQSPRKIIIFYKLIVNL